ncbi:MAG: hypothetical protein SGILL_000706 [Bacillariaceae sp.]
MATSSEKRNDSATQQRHRKLRVLVISMGGERQQRMEEMFRHNSMIDDFEPPVFSPGVPSRELRNRYRFLYHANQAGLLPEKEWQAIRAAHGTEEDASVQKQTPQQESQKFFHCLKDIEITKEGRRGSEWDLKLHYSEELWRKARGVNRGRSVLACTFAHLMAMKKCVSKNFDLILEDNVRCSPSSAVTRIWSAIDAKEEWAASNKSDDNSNSCHYLYFGWLGSVTNLKWILETHAPKRKFDRETKGGTDDKDNSNDIPTIFSFPRPEHLEEDLAIWEDDDDDEDDVGADQEPKDVGDSSANDKGGDDTPKKFQHNRPGGNPVWGAYAYWISKEGYEKLMESLRNDVGAVLWKGKRMRHYLVKPIDKILPRQTMALMGPSSVQLATHPAFFRAPMLTSKIHTQWDPEFCKSTDYQLRTATARSSDDSADGNPWSSLWLSPTEREIVHHYANTGDWKTIVELHHQEQDTECTTED